MNIFGRPLRGSITKDAYFYAFLIGIIISLIFLILTFLLPTLISSNYYQKSLGQLRSQARAIKNEFSNHISEIGHKQKIIFDTPFPEEKDEIFKLFKKPDLRKEIEGISYFNHRDGLILWLGNVVDPEKALFSEEERVSFLQQESSFLMQHKSSVYMVSLKKVREDEYVIFYRLLAFSPQFKAQYLREYKFLKERLLSNSTIYYWDFREDVSGLEKLFSRHKDEYYLEQPRLEDEVQPMLFPLRNENNNIVATVTLSSPALTAKISSQKEFFLLVFYLILGTSLISLLIHFVKSPSFYKERKPLPGLFIILILIGLRFIFFPLSNLEKIQSLAIFSPSSASFFSLWDLTKSPGDIFLTTFILFLIMGCGIHYSRGLLESKKRKSSLFLTGFMSSTFITISLGLMLVFQEFLFRLVYNSNINLLRFSFDPSFFLLHLSILFLFLVCFFGIFIGLKVAWIYSVNLILPILIYLQQIVGYVFFFRDKNIPLLLLLQAAILLSVLFLAYLSKLTRRKEVLVAVFLLCALFIYASLHYSSSSRNRSLVENSLQNIIKSQESWGTFLLDQSMLEIDDQQESIISFLRGTETYDLAHSLWERTAVAKFNWYSSLEMLSPGGTMLSRFSLNVPKLYSLNLDLPLNQEWSISHLNIPFMGEEKDFLLGYKDWFEEENHLGRTILYLSIDYDMLPFLYSANPYFELLRVTSIPSLNQFNFGFAIFDSEGRLLFNPNRISSGIAPDILGNIEISQNSLWSLFTDKNRKFQSFYFRKDNRIYSLFMPQKNFFNYSSEFIKLLFFYFGFFLFFLFLVSLALGKKIRNPLWSFSNRVYISFAAIALIPLLLFTFFSRSFFAQIFTQQFKEKAEAQASFAHRLVDEFVLLQQEEMVSLTLPPEDVVLSISSAISNDVNLYQDGKLISSSRREFFDYGLLPELIDGEIYYKIQYENNPFYTQTQRIGDYSFHNITTPYYLGGSLLLISLPFPLEQQEISKATEDLIEFLFFISVFFIAVVLIFARGIGSTVVTPVKELLKGTKEVGAGNLEISITHKPQDEMKTLIDGFNAMVENLKKHQQDLADMSKKVAWAEMARKVAHEVKNPLTPIQLSAEHLLRVYHDKKEDFDKALKESASYIINEVENLRKIAQEFLETSKERSLQLESFDLKELMKETVAPYKKMLSERIKFKEKYEGRDFHFMGDKGRMKIVLRNILTNAIEAIRGQGEIEIKAVMGKAGIKFEISDSGTGMEKDMLNRIFDPDFSTKDVGTGLGLPIAKKIIEDHGGTIKASSEENKGTKISIKLPQ